jgi:hypothetical protein
MHTFCIGNWEEKWTLCCADRISMKRIIVKVHPGLAGAPVKYGGKSNREDPLHLVQTHLPVYVPAK